MHIVLMHIEVYVIVNQYKCSSSPQKCSDSEVVHCINFGGRGHKVHEFLLQHTRPMTFMHKCNTLIRMLCLCRVV